MGILNKKWKEYKAKTSKASIMGFILKLWIGTFRFIMAKVYLRHCNQLGKWVTVYGKPKIENLGEMYIGDEVRVWSKIIQAKLYTGNHGKLIIGRNTRINGAHIDAQMEVKIGNNVRIAPYVVIMDSDFHDVADHFADGVSKPIIIEDNVWIALRATVLKGVHLGEGCVIGCGAIVTKDVPPYTVVGGVPARVIRKLK